MQPEDRPLGGYAILMTVYAAIAGGFVGWFRRSGRKLPDTVRAGDLALVTVSTHKLSRVITKEKITAGVRAPFTEYQGPGGPAEVEEAAVGTGLRRAIGELLICPYCVSTWIATGFTAGLLVAPRATRQVASVLTALFGADVLNLGYARAQRR
jgi:hypothetical protein